MAAGIPTGWYSIPNVVKDPEFVALMRAEAEGSAVWASWVLGVGLGSSPVPKGSSNLNLNIALIQDEAEDQAGWARWAPGTQPENTGNLQLDMDAAITASFVLTI